MKGDLFLYKNFLTAREEEIFLLLLASKSTKDIALKLDITEKTVRNHISNVIGKLGVTSRTQALITLIKSGIIKL